MKDPLHGITLETILKELVKILGWETMAKSINIRCFKLDPSIKSSLSFLRKTPWARKKVEAMYLWQMRKIENRRKKTLEKIQVRP
jgi:uncharacterized protein (DUF2132 family)